MVNKELWTGQQFWLCVQCDLDLQGTDLGRGHDTPLGHGKQLCEKLSRPGQTLQFYGADMDICDFDLKSYYLAHVKVIYTLWPLIWYFQPNFRCLIEGMDCNRKEQSKQTSVFSVYFFSFCAAAAETVCQTSSNWNITKNLAKSFQNVHAEAYLEEQNRPSKCWISRSLCPHCSRDCFNATFFVPQSYFSWSRSTFTLQFLVKKTETDDHRTT